MFSDKANAIFQEVIKTYKVLNTVDQPFTNKYDKDDIRNEMIRLQNYYSKEFLWSHPNSNAATNTLLENYPT